MNLYLMRYGIDSVCRIAAFFGQVSIESQGLTRMGENLNYTTAAALNRAYGGQLQEKNASHYLRSPERLANLVYADRMGNGDEASGDGWRYRGRGLIQLTGQEQYARFSKDVGIDAIGDPDLLNQPSMAVLSACWYWARRGLNSLADSGSLESITKRINPARMHLDERLAATRHAHSCLRSEISRTDWRLLP